MTGRVDSGLKRDLIFISLGHGVFALGQWAIVSAIAKVAGLEAMAVFGLTLAIANPIYFLANMALRVAFASDAGRDFTFGDYWLARVAGLLAAAFAMGVAALLTVGAHGIDGASALLLFALIKSADGLFDLLYGARQREGSTMAIAISLLLRALLAPAACLAGLIFSDGALWAGLAGWCLAAVALFLLREAAGVRARLRAEPAAAGARAVIAKAWPLGVGAALASLETAIPRYVIEWEMEPGALGYFTGVFFFFQASVVVSNAFGSAASAHLGRAHAADDRRGFLKLTGMLALLGAGLGVCGVVFAIVLGPWALAVIYTPDYAAYGTVLTLTMAAAGLRFIASFLQYALVAAKRFKTHMLLHMVLATTAAIVAPPLVIWHGMEGAALSLIAVGGVQVGLLIWLTARR
jgi:O-antigen/teichoic acid export membrane protein